LGFLPDFAERDNATLPSMLQGPAKAQALSYLDEVQELSELREAFDSPVKTYSSGMRSRLGLSTPLITHVDILPVDEILSVGDAYFKHKAEKAMKERIGGDQTVVFVSHSDKQIEELCDRAIWINEGSIFSSGSAQDVIREYKQHIDLLNQVGLNRV
jgi:lipopolysaccharide transport system ATP-binding protein